MKRAHKSLDVWQEGVALCTEIYQLTKSFPRSEEFGLISQMRRASVSVPSNIAEGAARGSANEFVRFLNIAAGSLSELDTQLELAKRLGYVHEAQYAALEPVLESLSAKLFGLLRKLRTKNASSS